MDLKEFRLFSKSEKRHKTIELVPFWEELKSYRLSYFKNDIFAAITVALLTLPQSMAYSLLAGLPLKAGLFSAIFGVMLMASFGSSRFLVAGPTTGGAILIQTVIANTIYTYFPNISGAEMEVMTLHILTQIVFVVGVVQILASLFNIGKLLEFISKPVVLAYFSGVIVSITFNQLYHFTGIKAGEKADSVIFQIFYFFNHIFELRPITFGVGLFSLFFLLFLKKKVKKLPSAILMIIGSSCLTFFLNSFSEVKVNTMQQMGFEKELHFGFSLPIIDFKLISEIFPSIMAIAFFVIMEVFSVARSISAVTGQSVKINQDIFGTGIGNAALGCLFGSMPTSGGFSRSLLNFQSKAKTRFSALFVGVVILLIIFFCWPLVQFVPLVALAALLLSMIPILVDLEQVKLCLKATKGDALVFTLTFASCLIFRLDVAFFVGIVISICSYLKRASVPRLVEYAFNAHGHLMLVLPESEVHREVRIIGIGGELFFAAVDLFEGAIQKVAEDPYVKVIVLRFNGVYHVDASICFAIIKLHEYLRATNRHLVISGIIPEVWQIFYRTHLVAKIGPENFFLTDETNPQLSTWKACLRANELI